MGPRPRQLDAALRLGLRILGGRIELRRDEDLLARDPARAHGGADGRLVPVALRRVDVAVPGLERGDDRALALGAFDELPARRTPGVGCGRPGRS